MTRDLADIRKIVAEAAPRIVALRRDIHRHPETAYQEKRTAAKVSAELKRLGIPHRTRVAGTGIVAVIEGKRPGPCVAFRADMDALPITEENTFAWRSATPGAMHACGHDGHTANLVGVAEVLSRLRDRLAGSVKLIFQPAEEGGGGAARMIAEGALEDPRPDVIYAFHNGATIPRGKIAWRPGPMCASTTAIDLVFRGRGGHAAAPQAAVDSVVMAAQFISAVQTVSSRRTDPLERVVVTFGKFTAGTARNIIPEEATLNGTLRAFREPTRAKAAREIARIAEAVADAAGGRAMLQLSRGYPPVINDERAAEFLRDVALETVGARNVVVAPAGMGAEDFSYFLAEVPGALFRIGNGTADRPNHSARYDFDDRILPVGMTFMSLVALRASSCS